MEKTSQKTSQKCVQMKFILTEKHRMDVLINGKLEFPGSIRPPLSRYNGTYAWRYGGMEVRMYEGKEIWRHGDTQVQG